VVAVTELCHFEVEDEAQMFNPNEVEDEAPSQMFNNEAEDEAPSQIFNTNEVEDEASPQMLNINEVEDVEARRK
jgi:hypothetical protein